MKPVLNAEYTDFIKQRSIAASRPKRFVQVTDSIRDRPGFIAPVSESTHSLKVRQNAG